jgi:translation initiation factor 1A
MVKNTKGGKGHKKCKNSTNKDFKRKVEYRQVENNEVYGIVTKLYGNGRVEVKFIDDITNKQIEKLEAKMGIIRNSIRRQRIKVFDVVLISIRTFQNDKVDIIYKYNDDEIRLFKKNREISESLINMTTEGKVFKEDNNIVMEDDDEDIDNIYIDEDEQKRRRRANINYMDIHNKMGRELNNEFDYEETNDIVYDSFGNIISESNDNIDIESL